MKKILVSVTNDLSTDQRVDKVCTTLSKSNFDVLLIGRNLKESLPLHRDYKTKRISLFFNSGFLFYAEYNCRLFFILLFLKKDILLSNDLDTLLPNYLVSIFQRKKLVYDSHELFSEIPELVNRPFIKSIWQCLEKKLLPKIKNCYTVCKSIAIHYNKKYSTHFKVIQNVPLKRLETSKNKSGLANEKRKIILYQGSVNIGRGLELMIETMPFLTNFVFVIIGSGDIINDLKTLVKQKKLENNILFLGRMSPKELQCITPLATIGISLEEDLGLNYRYALPNKIFDYIQAEVPVLVSDLPEMKQVILTYKVGEILENRNSILLAKQIKKMVTKDFSIALKKAKNTLIWENEIPQLLTIFNNLE